MTRTILQVLLLIFSIQLTGQITQGTFSGNIQTDFHYYQRDDKLGLTDSSLQDKRTGLNTFANFLYTSDHLEAGIRYEAYLPPIRGFENQYEGHGIANKYIRYHRKMWEVTVGSIYEQFGNGMILRTYQDWALGYDNALNGLRIKIQPVDGIYLKMVSGVQRYYWDQWDREDDRGIVTGIDGEIHLNEVWKNLSMKKTRIIIGGSFVTKNQADNHPIYKMPENVAGIAGRLNLSRNNFNLIGEYAYKINDPSSDNGLIYKPGEAIFAQGSWATKGFSISLACKRLDNMGFRSDRYGSLNDLMINYLPAINKQHTYSMPAKYPYATQPNGEMGLTAGLGYKIKKGSKLGGKYGTDLALTFSRITDIVRKPVNDQLGIPGTLGYTSVYFDEGDKYFEDLSLEIGKKFNKKIKMTVVFSWIYYNISVIEGHPGEEDVVSKHLVADLTYRLTTRQALRFETQHALTKQHEGNWGTMTLEYTNKGFFASVQDLWNYGNPEKDKQIHYYMIATGYTRNATRIAIGYGRQKEGINCVGGVCKYVPAISGFTLSLTTSF